MAKKGQKERRAQKKCPGGTSAPEGRGQGSTSNPMLSNALKNLRREMQEYIDRTTELPAEHQSVIRALSKKINTTKVVTGEEAFATAAKIYFDDRTQFFKMVFETNDPELIVALYDMLEQHAKIAINLLVMMNPYVGPEVQNAIQIASLGCYIQDRDHFLDKLYYEPCSLESKKDHKHKCLLVFENLGDIAKHKAALVVRVDSGKYRTGIGTEFQRDCDLYEYLAEEVTKLYMEARPEFEARYESKKSHAEMVGRMKQVSKAWNEDCKVSTKWNLMVPELVFSTRS